MKKWRILNTGSFWTDFDFRITHVFDNKINTHANIRKK